MSDKSNENISHRDRATNPIIVRDQGELFQLHAEKKGECGFSTLFFGSGRWCLRLEDNHISRYAQRANASRYGVGSIEPNYAVFITEEQARDWFFENLLFPILPVELAHLRPKNLPPSRPTTAKPDPTAETPALQPAGSTSTQPKKLPVGGEAENPSTLGDLEMTPPDSPQRLAKLFGFSVDTLKRRFKDGTIRHKKLSSKRYQIAINDLPTVQQAKFRNASK